MNVIQFKQPAHLALPAPAYRPCPEPDLCRAGALCAGRCGTMRGLTHSGVGVSSIVKRLEQQRGASS